MYFRFCNKYLLKFKNWFNDYYNQSVVIKSPEEIAYLRKAGEITVQIYQRVLKSELKPGISEIDLALRIDKLAKELGADKEMAFSTMVSSGKNTSLVHSNPTTRLIQKGDIVQFDFGAKYKGYCSDMSRVLFMGKKKNANNKVKRMLGLVKKAQAKALEKVKSQVLISAVAKIVDDYFKKKKMQFNFLHSLGHGVGIEIHEFPRIIQASDKGQKLLGGMVVTIEPGLYFPREYGARIEDTVLVTESGYENLTNASKEIYFA